MLKLETQSLHRAHKHNRKPLNNAKQKNKMVLLSVLHKFKRSARKTSIAQTMINTIYISIQFLAYKMAITIRKWFILIYTNVDTNKYTNKF